MDTNTHEDPGRTDGEQAGPAVALALPVITVVSPSCTPLTPGTVVTITGTGFSGISSVSFNATAATFTVVSDNLISTVVPAGTSGTVCITVTTPGGATTYCLPPCTSPQVRTVCPGRGPIAGGTKVTVVGTNLNGTPPVVKFGGIPGTGVVVDPSGCSLTVFTPPHTSGTVGVTVTTPAGTSSLGQFTYFCPTLATVCPGSGPASGGNTVTLIGSDMQGVSAVVFDSHLIIPPNFQVDPSGSFLTLTAPLHAAGSVPVYLYTTTPSGLSCVSKTLPYTYLPVACPTVTAMSPAFGPAGTYFVILGTNLWGVTVLFGGVPATGVAVAPGGTFLTGYVPRHAPGHVAVTLTRPCCNTITVPGGYTYQPGTPPLPVDFFPTTGNPAGGNLFVVTGTDLADAQVTFGGNPATEVIVDQSGTSLTGIAPSGTGTVDVTVATPAGSATLPGAYTYVPGPTVVSVVPSVGPEPGGNAVTITGTNLAEASTVDFDATPASSFTIINSTQIAAIAPAGIAGTVDVTVATPAGSATLPGAYTYVPGPTVVSVVPSVGPEPGGNAVTITGTNLAEASTVDFDATPASSFTIINSTQIAAIAPAGIAGTVDVTVATPAGSATLPGAYTYVPGPTG